jgi:hypothetical protein
MDQSIVVIGILLLMVAVMVYLKKPPSNSSWNIAEFEKAVALINAA